MQDIIFKKVGSTYHGKLDFSRFYWDDEWDDELEDEVRQATWEEFIDDLPNLIKQIIREHSELIQAYEKYGIHLVDFDFLVPKSYNYTDDKLKILFEYFPEDVLEAVEGDLKGEIRHYLDEVKQDSRDGYISKEPNSYDDIVAQLDPNRDATYNWNIFYAVFYAIECTETLGSEWGSIRLEIQDAAAERYSWLLSNNYYSLKSQKDNDGGTN